MFLNFQIGSVILNTDDEQFTLTAKKSLHITFNACSLSASIKHAYRHLFACKKVLVYAAVTFCNCSAKVNIRVSVFAFVSAKVDVVVNLQRVSGSRRPWPSDWQTTQPPSTPLSAAVDDTSTLRNHASFSLIVQMTFKLDPIAPGSVDFQFTFAHHHHRHIRLFVTWHNKAKKYKINSRVQHII